VSFLTFGIGNYPILMEAFCMNDKMLFSLSIFLTGLGAGIALVAFVAPRSRLAKGRLIGCRSEKDLPSGKRAA
jgi:hypothetical protein